MFPVQFSILCPVTASTLPALRLLLRSKLMFSWTYLEEPQDFV